MFVSNEQKPNLVPNQWLLGWNRFEVYSHIWLKSLFYWYKISISSYILCEYRYLDLLYCITHVNKPLTQRLFSQVDSRQCLAFWGFFSWIRPQSGQFLQWVTLAGVKSWTFIVIMLNQGHQHWQTTMTTKVSIGIRLLSNFWRIPCTLW